MIVELSHEIQAPADLVWSVTSDVERWPRWMPTVQSVTAIMPGPMAPGSRYLLKQPLQAAAAWEVTRYEASQAFEWERRENGLLLFVGTHEVEKHRANTKIRVSLKAFGVVNTLLRPLFAAVIATKCRAMERHCLRIIQARRHA